MFTCQCFRDIILETYESQEMKESWNLYVDSLKKKDLKSQFSFSPQIILVMEFSQKHCGQKIELLISEIDKIYFVQDLIEKQTRPPRLGVLNDPCITMAIQLERNSLQYTIPNGQSTDSQHRDLKGHPIQSSIAVQTQQLLESSITGSCVTTYSSVLVLLCGITLSISKQPHDNLSDI